MSCLTCVTYREDRTELLDSLIVRPKYLTTWLSMEAAPMDEGVNWLHRGCRWRCSPIPRRVV
jgi:hypothetical protein